jgi:type II secretory pathway component PulC
LDEVYARKVIITNAGERQTLSMDDEEAKKLAAAQTGPAGDGPAPATAAPAAAGPSEPGDRVSLDKQEFIQELYVNYADIVKKCKPEMYRDADGNVAGITASNISEIPLAKRLNLSDGDVLQTINNEKIDSQEKIIQLINKYRDTNTFRIGILRGGKPVMTTYSFK